MKDVLKWKSRGCQARMQRGVGGLIYSLGRFQGCSCALSGNWPGKRRGEENKGGEMQCVSVIRILAPHADSCNVIVTFNLARMASCGEFSTLCVTVHQCVVFCLFHQVLQLQWRIRHERMIKGVLPDPEEEAAVHREASQQFQLSDPYCCYFFTIGCGSLQSSVDTKTVSPASCHM